jgi:integrase/recombinase XerD
MMNTTALTTQPQAPGDPWARCIALYLASIQERSESTYKGYVNVLRAFFTMFPGSPDLRTREDVERFLHTPAKIGRNQGGPPAAGTRNWRLSVLSSLYKFASQYTYSGEDGRPVRLFDGVPPTAGIRLSKTPRPRRVLTDAELERLFSVIPRNTRQGLRDLSLFTFFLLTGRRLNEGRNLLYGDIMWDTITESDGSRRPGWVYRWIGEKGLHGEERVSELPTLAKCLIDEWLEASGRLPLQSDDPVWVGIERPGLALDPYAPLSAGAITAALKRYAKLAGIDKPVSTHWLRHASAKARYAKDKDIVKIMKALGHSNLSSTHRYLENMLGNADAGARELSHTFNFLLK